MYRDIYRDYEQYAYSKGLVPKGVKTFSRELRAYYKQAQLSGKVTFVGRSLLVVKGVALVRKTIYEKEAT